MKTQNRNQNAIDPNNLNNEIADMDDLKEMILVKDFINLFKMIKFSKEKRNKKTQINQI